MSQHEFEQAMASALRAMADRMAARPHSTAVEQAFRELADELDRVDPDDTEAER